MDDASPMTIVEPTLSHYLSGNFAPVSDERTEEELAVTGQIPPSLNGRLLRIGPNPVVAPDPATYHWFTGHGMVHGVRLREGRADWYRNRFVRSDTVTEARGGPPVEGPRHGMGDGSANTNVIGHAGRTFAIVEAGAVPVELSYDLETVCRSDFGGTLAGGFTAHPKRDPATGELHAVTYYWEWDFLRYVVVGTDGLVRRTVDIPVADSPMVHDCAITDTSVLLFDFPVCFDLEMVMGGASLPYRWMPAHGARVGVLPRDGSGDDVRWCEVDPCFVFHPLNAYDTGEGDERRIVVDLVVHPSMFETDLLGPNEGPPVLERWTIDPARGSVDRVVIDERPQEFPRPDERFVGRPHRFGWSAAFTPTASGPTLGSILHHDLAGGPVIEWSPGPGRAAQEAVFVPESADGAEGEGWLMSYVHDSGRDGADVVILRADDMAAGPVATIHLPVRVPFGFHGNWVPDGQ
jgi:carotenoid cleavage dioxygenase